MLSVEDMSKEVRSLRILLRRLFHASKHAEANTEVAIMPDGFAIAPDCGVHLECQSCFSSGCAWCLGERICVQDAVWMCQGKQDQVGAKIGAVKVCPDVAQEERLQRLRSEAAEKEEVLLRELESLGVSPGQWTRGCVGWKQTGTCSPDGPREPQKDLACDFPVPSDVSGYCECADGHVTSRSGLQKTR